MKKEILKHFKDLDLKLFEIIKRYNPEIPNKSDPSNYYFELTKVIAYQQLTDKAASAIFSRLVNHFKKDIFTPNEILTLKVEDLRNFGFSNSKSNYILNIANASKEIIFEKLDNLSNDEIIEILTKIKGVGKWSAQMLLIFTLGREDVFSIDDLGIKKGVMKLYKLNELPDKKYMSNFEKGLSPFSTYAMLALWSLNDDKSLPAS